MIELTNIDLFAGIGGFALGFQRAGIKSIAHVEIDAKCRIVLARQFPNDQIEIDVKNSGKHNLPPSDIVSFGSPCQDLSVAGKRKGLNGERSGLFFEAIRIIQELKPRFAIWENVPGALSSNKGQDFREVLEALFGANVPMPRSGRWARAGMARNGQIELAWRILDAQYFGLAQRRKRLFVVVDFRGECAAEILFERESGAGDIAQGREAGQGVAGTLKSGSGMRGYPDPSDGNGGGLIAFSAGQSSGARSIAADENITPPIRGGSSGTNQVPTIAGTISSKWAKGTGWPSGNEVLNPIVAPLSTKPYADNQSQETKLIYPTLDGGTQGAKWGNNQWVDNGFAVVQPIAFTERTRKDGRNLETSPLAYALTNPGSGGRTHSRQLLVPSGVRRLTPTECERLQGFPDGWTDGQPDSPRYRQLGNAVAVPVIEWIGKRILARLIRWNHERDGQRRQSSRRESGGTQQPRA